MDRSGGKESGVAAVAFNLLRDEIRHALRASARNFTCDLISVPAGRDTKVPQSPLAMASGSHRSRERTLSSDY